jgi:hypothetical protein
MKNVGIFREYFESLIPLALEQNAHLPIFRKVGSMANSLWI